MRVAERARSYAADAGAAIDTGERAAQLTHDDPYSIILWFASLISAKTDRARCGLNEFDGSREYPPDHEGSAKVALIGFDEPDEVRKLEATDWS